MSWNAVDADWVGIEADRWARLNDYFRQNCDAVIENMRIMEAGENYTNGGTTYYDVDVNATLAAWANIEAFRWEIFYKPEGITALKVVLQNLCSVNSAQAFWRFTITNHATGATAVVDMGGLSPTATFDSRTYTGLSTASGFYSLSILAWNNTATVNVNFQAHEIYIRPII